jgi:hypothetical protein
MQKIAAIHDGGAQGWETLYLAIHLAARLGSPLLVLALPGGDDEPAPSLRAEKIRTGAAAAGIPVEILPVPHLGAGALLDLAGDLFTLLLPKDLVSEPGRLPALVEALCCPIWAVTERCEIRRLATLEVSTREPASSRYAPLLAQRLGQPLLIFRDGQDPVFDSPAEALKWERLEERSVLVMQQQVHLRAIDVLIFPGRDASFLEACAPALSCVLVLCPQNSGQGS